MKKKVDPWTLAQAIAHASLYSVSRWFSTASLWFALKAEEMFERRWGESLEGVALRAERQARKAMRDR